MLNNLSSYKKNSILYLIVIAAGIFFDQLSKLLVVAYLKPIYDLPLIKGVFHFTYSENRGAAFGMLSNDRWVFMLVSTIMIVGMCAYLF